MVLRLFNHASRRVTELINQHERLDNEKQQRKGRRCRGVVLHHLLDDGYSNDHVSLYTVDTSRESQDIQKMIVQ